MRDKTLALGAPGPFARLGQSLSLREWARPTLAAGGTPKKNRYGPPIDTPWRLAAAETRCLDAVLEMQCDHGEAARRMCLSPKTLSTYLSRAAGKMEAPNNDMAILRYALWKAEQAKIVETKETEPCG